MSDIKSNYMNLCRLCMATDNLCRIHRNSQGIELDLAIETCLEIKIQKGDGLPDCICTQCEDKLKEFYLFKKKCQISIKKLQQIFERNLSHKNIFFKDHIKREPNLDIEITQDHDSNISSIEQVDNTLDTCESYQKYIKEENIEIIQKIDSNIKELDNFQLEVQAHIKEENKNENIEKCNDKEDNIKNLECTNIKPLKSNKQKIKKINRKCNSVENLHVKNVPKAIFQCELCGNIFKTKVILKKHSSVHSGHKAYGCKLCPKRYTRSDNLSIHMRRHAGIRPYVCEICARSFFKSQDLHRHIRIHNDEKNYRCDTCGKQFKRSGDVRAHMRVHTGHHPFFCKHCPKFYKSYSGLQKHIKHHKKLN